MLYTLGFLLALVLTVVGSRTGAVQVTRVAVVPVLSFILWCLQVSGLCLELFLRKTLLLASHRITES